MVNKVKAFAKKLRKIKPNSVPLISSAPMDRCKRYAKASSVDFVTAANCFLSKSSRIGC